MGPQEGQRRIEVGGAEQSQPYGDRFRPKRRGWDVGSGRDGRVGARLRRGGMMCQGGGRPGRLAQSPS